MSSTKILTIIIFTILFSFNGYSTKNQCNNKRHDSIYDDLSKFLVQKKHLNNELKDTGKKYIEIFEVITKNDTVDIASMPFGIYIFQSKLCMDCSSFVLIKYQQKYIAFNKSNLNLIIKLIVEIKKNNPELINSEQFEAYIKNLLDCKPNTKTGQEEIIQNFGTLEYVYN